jgi:hypothetical protein
MYNVYTHEKKKLIEQSMKKEKEREENWKETRKSIFLC